MVGPLAQHEPHISSLETMKLRHHIDRTDLLFDGSIESNPYTCNFFHVVGQCFHLNNQHDLS